MVDYEHLLRACVCPYHVNIRFEGVCVCVTSSLTLAPYSTEVSGPSALPTHNNDTKLTIH